MKFIKDNLKLVYFFIILLIILNLLIYNLYKLKKEIAQVEMINIENKKNIILIQQETLNLSIEIEKKNITQKFIKDIEILIQNTTLIRDIVNKHSKKNDFMDKNYILHLKNYLNNSNDTPLYYCTNIENNKTFHHNRVCNYKYIHLSIKNGIYKNNINLKENVFPYSQLSTYINQGMERYWRPEIKSHINYPEVENRKVLLVYSPAAWPHKIGFHFLMNNMFPVFQVLENFFPDRLVKHLSNENIWNYNIDILTLGHGFSGGCQPISNDNSTQWLGIQDVFCADTHLNGNILTISKFRSRYNNPYENKTIIYENVIGGTGGSRSHWGEQYNKPEVNIYDLKLIENFKNAFLHFDKKCNSKLYRQSRLKRPLVLLSQRTTDGFKGFGDRVIKNIKEIESMLFKFKQNKTIDFDGTLIFSSNMTVYEQACAASRASIFIGVHGNQLAWTIFMEPGTTLVEISSFGEELYKKMVEINDMNYIHLRSSMSNVPVDKLEKIVHQSIENWNKKFNYK